VLEDIHAGRRDERRVEEEQVRGGAEAREEGRAEHQPKDCGARGMARGERRGIPALAKERVRVSPNAQGERLAHVL